MPEFALGAGFEASTLLTLIASLVAAIAILWAAWVGLGSSSTVQAERIGKTSGESMAGLGWCLKRSAA